MSPLAAAHALLPFWLPFVSLLALPFGFTAGWFAARALTPLAYRRVFAAKNAHWTERARLAWPARKWTGLANLTLSAVLGALLAHLGGPLSLLGPAVTGLLGGAAALLGMTLGSWPVARRLHGERVGGPGRFLASAVALLLVRGPHVVVACVVAAFMPPRFTGHGLEAGLLLSLGTVLLFIAAFGGGLALGRLLGLIRGADERLLRAAASAATRAGVPPTGAVVMTCTLPVAFAIPLRRILVFADSALALFDDEELAAVVEHETGHLTESRSVTFQRVAGVLVFSLLMATPSLAGEGGRAALLVTLVVLLPLVVFGVFARRTAFAMESRADAHAAQGSAPGVYARALETLHETALIPAVLGKRHATHPDLWDRMTAAGAPPPWPKPAPPAGGAAGRIALVALSLAAFVGAEVCRNSALTAVSRHSPLAAVALTGGEPWPLSELGRARAAGGRPEDAVALYRAAFTLDGRPGHLANAAFVESHAGRCDAARALAIEAGRAVQLAGTAEWDRHLAARAADVTAHCGEAVPGSGDEN